MREALMYISPHKVLAHTGRMAAWKDGEKPAPVTVEWDLSNRCSLGCEWCHFAHTHTRGPWAGKALLPMAFSGTGDMADPAVVTRGLTEMAEAGVLGVVWSGGGEPTLNPHWPEIVAHAASVGLRQGMYTLGGHLGPDEAKHLATSATWVVVSLDAVDSRWYADEKGVPQARFDAATAGIERLASHKKAVVGVSFLLHALNWRKAQQMLSLARSLGATYATFRPVVYTSTGDPGKVTGGIQWITDAAGLLRDLAEEPDVEIDVDRFRQYRDWSGHGYSQCYGIRFSSVVTPDGRMWVCCQRRGIQDSLLGDLSKESFSDIWSRHPGSYAVNSGCRAMCRLHQMNQTLADVYAERQHVEFV